MPSYILVASVGDTPLGTVRQNAGTKRWEVDGVDGHTFTFRDPEGAVEALHMLSLSSPAKGLSDTEAGLRACIDIANAEIARLQAAIASAPKRARKAAPAPADDDGVI